MPASEKELKIASILYYQVFGEELPIRDYKKQDIQYIIEQIHLQKTQGIDGFSSITVH